MAAPYSDLQVVPPRHSEYSGLQLPDYSGLHHHQQKDPTYPEAVASLPTSQEYKSLEPEKTASKGVICGIAARTFWTILAVVIAIVVIAAAVGGGVGGSIAAKNRTANNAANSASSSASTQNAANSASSSASTQNAGTTTPPSKSSSSHGPLTSPPSSSPTSTPPVTTTQLKGPSTTLLRDCPSSNNTLYSVDIGSVLYFRKLCNLSYRNSLGESAMIDSPTSSLNDCIDLCAAYNVQNSTEIANGTSNVCNAVCWRNTFSDGDEFPGSCFDYTTLNSSSTFNVQDETICDSAAWINQQS
jgi:hypothetical protein